MATQVDVNKDVLSITRVFDAPRESVWKAWTDPELMKKWWGPKEFTSPFARIDLRIGEKYLFCMRSPEGKDYWSTGKFLEIVKPERLAFTDSFSDEHGNIVSASYYGMTDDFPLELKVIVTFSEYEGGTRMSLQHFGMPSGKIHDEASEGWNGSFDKLAELVKTL